MGNTAWCAGEHSRDDVREREKLALCVDTVSRAGGGGADADATLSDCATATALRGGDTQASTARATPARAAAEENADYTLYDRATATALRGGDAQASTARATLARAAAKRTQTLRSAAAAHDW